MTHHVKRTVSSLKTLNLEAKLTVEKILSHLVILEKLTLFFLDPTSYNNSTKYARWHLVTSFLIKIKQIKCYVY